MDKNVYAAIAMAIYEYSGNNVHDTEPGIITIQPRCTLECQILRCNPQTLIQ